MMEIISRQEAIAAGLNLYFTGMPCKYGHVGVMHVKGGCMACRKEWRPKSRSKEALEKHRLNNANHRARNLEKEKERNRKYYAANAETKRIKNAKWRNENREKANKAVRAWREANPERAKELISTWNKRNPDARRVHRQNRKERERQGNAKLSVDLVDKLWKLQKGRCACCGEHLGENYHLDHIMPLALGGLNIDANVQLLRQKCNNEKRAKHPVDFMQSRGFLL